MPTALAQSKQIERLSLLEGGCHSLMVGLGETYLVAFALFKGVSPTLSGAVAVAPVVLGSFLQLVLSAYAPRFFTCLKDYVLFCATLQALSLLVMGGFANFMDASSHTLLFFISVATIYWGAAHAAAPAWSGWIGQVIAPERRSQFLSTRMRISQGLTLLGILIGGGSLQMIPAEHRGDVFAALMFLAGGARLASANYLAQHREDHEPMRKVQGFRLRELQSWLTQDLIGAYLIFMFLTNVAVQTSAPYFTSYMLKGLDLSYGKYSFLTSCTFVARILMGSVAAVYVQRKGPRGLIILGAIGVIPIPFLWTMRDDYFYLCFLQVMTGVVWGAHELGLMLLLFHQMSHQERYRCLKYSNVCNSVGMAFGAYWGGILLGQAPVSQVSFHRIFELSSSLRLLPLMFLPLLLTNYSLYRKVGLGVKQLTLLGWQIPQRLIFSRRKERKRAMRDS